MSHEQDEVARLLQVEISRQALVLRQNHEHIEGLRAELAAAKGREERLFRLAWWRGRDHGISHALTTGETEAAYERDVSIHFALTEKPKGLRCRVCCCEYPEPKSCCRRPQWIPTEKHNHGATEGSERGGG